MITSLEIRNYALIDELRVDFSKGLTIITGETGAGKSIILGGLGLIMGQRADTKALFEADKKCIVEAHFQVGAYALRDFFEQHDLDYDDELVIRREILPSGKTRAFINDSPANLSVLQDLSRSLIDLHQQFDTLDIHNVSFQLRMLDALADNNELLKAYSQGYRSYLANKQELNRLVEEQEKMLKESDFIAFQLNEFHEADIQPNEGTLLERELKLLANAEEIKRVLGNAGMQIADSERAVVEQLKSFLPGIESLMGVNANIDSLAERLTSAIYELEDIGRALIDLADETELDTHRIAELEDRIGILYKLQQKHGVKSTDQLLEIQEEYEKKAKSHKTVGTGIKSLQESIQTQRKVLIERSLELRERRKGVAPKFLEQIHERLGKLSMVNARLDIQFEDLEEPGATGMDQVEYLFSANKGSRMQSIKGVASGGELSRLTLVTKSLVASSIPLPTLIFDEIDSGVSGDVALRMGDILHELSAQHQVVTITHSPQVASKADRHYYVYKEDIGDRTATRVRELDKQNRIHAIAVMLSSDPPSKPAIANAKGLLSTARA